MRVVFKCKSGWERKEGNEVAQKCTPVSYNACDHIWKLKDPATWSEW